MHSDMHMHATLHPLSSHAIGILWLPVVSILTSLLDAEPMESEWFTSLVLCPVPLIIDIREAPYVAGGSARCPA